MAEEKNEQNEGQQQEAQKEKNSGGKPGSSGLMLYGLIAGVIVLNAIAAFVLFQVTKPSTPDEEKDKTEVSADSSTARKNPRIMGATIDEPITAIVNIPAEDGTRYLKVSFVLEYNENNKQLPLEIDKRRPKFNNMLINMLSNYTLKELRKPESKEAVRKEFLRQINNSLPVDVGEVQNVYLKEFLIQ